MTPVFTLHSMTLTLKAFSVLLGLLKATQVEIRGISKGQILILTQLSIIIIHFSLLLHPFLTQSFPYLLRYQTTNYYLQSADMFSKNLITFATMAFASFAAAAPLEKVVPKLTYQENRSNNFIREQ